MLSRNGAAKHLTRQFDRPVREVELRRFEQAAEMQFPQTETDQAAYLALCFLRLVAHRAGVSYADIERAQGVLADLLKKQLAWSDAKLAARLAGQPFDRPFPTDGTEESKVRMGEWRALLAGLGKKR